MLALRLVLSEAPPTLVFDEVDAGIGGEAGNAVGRLLADLARRHQVLCVTHLAQVAAHADAHVVVAKGQSRGRTIARAEVVEGDARVGRAVADARRPRRLEPRTPPRRGAARDGGAGVRHRRCGGSPASGESHVNLWFRSGRETITPTAVSGLSRMDHRTKDLVKRLQPGEIAVIDHRDLDRIAADALVDAGIVAVVNADDSISGRYPNGGPIRLLEAGIPLVDQVGPELFDSLEEGDILRVTDDGQVWRDEELIGKGTVRHAEEVEAVMAASRAAIGSELERFAVNTLEYVQREAQIMFEPLELPPLRTDFQGRHALVVVRGLRLPGGPARVALVHP